MANYQPLQGSYHAAKLTVAGSNEDAVTRSLTSSRVEMNPHQVDAALFALKSPLSKGVLLADEVVCLDSAQELCSDGPGCDCS